MYQVAQNDVDIRSAVSWEEAERFIDEADLEFRIFVGRYRHFGPWEIIGRWWLSRIPGVRQSSEKPEDACQQRAADLLGHFHDAFGTAKWREFKFHKEYLSHSTHLPFLTALSIWN